MIKGILFDLGGVVAFNHLDEQLDHMAKELKIDADALRELEKIEHEKLVLGKLSVKEFCSSIRNKFELEKDSATLVLIWERIYEETTDLNRDLVRRIIELKKIYKVGLISNIFDITATHHQRQKLFYFFKPVILSCRRGIAKPDIKMFATAIKEMELKGKEVLYIDDSEDHIKVAKEFGMKTVLFEDNTKLFKELKKLKIK
ncbi:MAG: HAD-IA family hydrolase [Candidatus Diapherotrites archaeon]|jgi:epoxide hydrolase-like predicted phosphatase|uniref:HAD-IA family hydrolase n=1 Tax=Candidatus Iainarchaeum sp. TaxID=3101447 RepID=A0A8T5GF25_9ARCH|nr:HAD-IA family hydrolase [Candidatus Diapherotrites archaeon]MBT7241311.1 HAD-IA family hydrolase [Candidatus Diapherotrites archaeon]